VMALLDKNEWARWLKYQANFHSYSWRNTILIMMQYEGATRVAGYRTWQKLGRQVNKGEKSIRILAPMIGKQRNDDGSESTRIYGFREVSVFDINQTSGEELPSICHELGGDDLKEMLRVAAIEAPLPVIFDDLREGLHGFVNSSKIVVRAGDPVNDQFQTVLHETAHYELGHIDGRKVATEQAELEADSVAYVVGQHFGIEFGDFTFGYLASWVSGDAEALHNGIKDSLQVISNAAKKIIGKLEGAMIVSGV